MKIILFAVLLMASVHSVTGQVRVTSLTVENSNAPLGIGTQVPRISWKIISDHRKVTQIGYEIRVSEKLNTLDKGNVWNTGKITSDQSVNILYSGAPLRSGQVYYWKVRIWDNNGKVSPWSEPGKWETGLFTSSDWNAKWIESGLPEDTVLGPSPLLRKTFKLKPAIKSARLYITSHGLYEARINGKRVGDSYLTPGWTSYNKRLPYQVYDVTSYLNPGKNALGVLLGDGWYRGFLAWENNKRIYGNNIGLLAQMEITYQNDAREVIISDGSWKTSLGPILACGIYNGEWYDARKEMTGWDTPDYIDSDWKPVKENDVAKDILVTTENEPIRKHEIIKPIKVILTPKGETVLDYGQNLVGWIRFKVKGKAGDIVSIYHAEVLDKTGNFYLDNLRAATAKVQYILKGGGEEEYEPHFSFFGFRYIRLEGFPGNVDPGNFSAVVLYSDIKLTGNFECSNPLVNQLQHNIQWGQRGNFLDVPTDCPQRDERLGWTGDAQVFFRTAAYNFDVDNFFSKWMKDLAADQVNGKVPWVIPNPLGANNSASAGWADAATIIPWGMYQAYGDKRVLETQYSSMKAWVDYIQRTSVEDLWNSGFHFGDWLFYRPFDDNDGLSAVTDKYLIAQTFYAHSTDLLIKTAGILGKTEDVTTYTQLLKRIKEAFLKEYVTPNGRLISGTQTANVLALNFNMLPEELWQPTADKLVANIKFYNYHLTTGFLGTPYLCHVLTRFGHTDVAYKLLLQETYPSWLYPVKMGATTIWERWDGIRPDGSFQTPGMNSFNHYAYGAIGDWLYRAVSGIDTYDDGVGFKHIRIKPYPGGNLSFANADLETHYGKVSSHWKSQGSDFNLNVEIPPNTTAQVYIQTSDINSVKENGMPVFNNKDIKVLPSEKDFVVVQVGSGHYQFSSKR